MFPCEVYSLIGPPGQSGVPRAELFLLVPVHLLCLQKPSTMSDIPNIDFMVSWFNFLLDL